MTDFLFQELFPLGPDTTKYRQLTNEFVSSAKFEGQDILKVRPEALTLLASEAIRDISHLLRSSHLEQLGKILNDPAASKNDKFVALELIKNANISAAGILPMCQDTGTAKNIEIERTQNASLSVWVQHGTGVQRAKTNNAQKQW